jgi:hypothetical protein
MILHTLTIEDAGVTDEGALSLSLGLQSNSSLHTLSLPRNHITSYGLEHLTDCLSLNLNLYSL